MLPLALAASLFLADQPAAATADVAAPPAAEAAPQAASAADVPARAGAQPSDYEFVAWCYGVLSGYVELHDQVMPEVTRIEETWRRPGSKLADDLKVYAEQQKQAKSDLKLFQGAMTAAEKASLKPINSLGATALRRGRAVWNAGPEVSKARVAQEWMSWTLPAACPATAEALEKRAKLLGASFQVNAEPDAPADAPAKN